MTARARLATLGMSALLAAAPMTGCRITGSADSPPVDDAGIFRPVPADDAPGEVTASQPPELEPPPAKVAASSPVTRSTDSPIPTGRACRIHLRRDAIGLSGLAPLSIQQVSPATRAAALDGTVEQATDDWVVLRAARGRTYWVRVDGILAVEFLDGK